MPAQLIVAVVVEALDRGVLDGAVHALDLAVGPRMIDLCEPVLDAVLSASHVEHVSHVSRGRPVCVARRIAELDAVVGKHCVDFVSHHLDQGDEEGGCIDAVCLLDQLDEGELGRSVDGNEEVKLAFGRLHLGGFRTSGWNDRRDHEADIADVNGALLDCAD